MKRTSSGSIKRTTAVSAAVAAGVLTMSAFGAGVAVAAPAEGGSAPVAIAAAAGSGIDWGFNPADHPQPTPDTDNSWGAYGESVGSTYWSFNWFMNYTDKDQVITGHDLTQTGGFGNIDMTTCNLPIVIPAGGSASCEFSYKMDHRDADRITIDIVWVGDNQLELDSTIMFKTTGKPTDPGSGGTDPGNGGTNPGNGGTDPGNGDTDPGNGGSGGEGTDPGNEGTDPGNGGTDPGNGNTGTTPGDGGSSGGTGGGNGSTPTPSDTGKHQTPVSTGNAAPAELANTGDNASGVLGGVAASILAGGAGLLGIAAKRRQMKNSI